MPAFRRQRRHVLHEPIVPPREGQAPGFVVVCLDCGFAHDAHGQDGDDAVKSIAPTHQRGHRLVARSVNYDAHPIYHA